MSDQADPLKKKTLEELDKVLASYELKRTETLHKAFMEGGLAAITKLEDEYKALQDAFFSLLNSKLATNSANYPNLMKQTEEATKEIEKAIKDLESVTKVFDAMTKTVNLIGRILILFGI